MVGVGVDVLVCVSVLSASVYVSVGDGVGSYWLLLESVVGLLVVNQVFEVSKVQRNALSWGFYERFRSFEGTT